MAVDQRFYLARKALTFGSIIDKLELAPRDAPEKDITGISSFEAAGAGDLCFFEGDRFPHQDISPWQQGACLVDEKVAAKVQDLPQLIGVSNPRQIFMEIASSAFAPKIDPGQDQSAVVHETALVGENCVIGAGAVIGRHTQIGANCVIGPGVQIGGNCRIGSNVSISFALIGNDVCLLAGARIGEAGFGLSATAAGLQDIPHFGRVILQDNVTIGANSCVDRGQLEDTLIGEGSKIDNLCHIGHNTQIGRNVVMAAFAGISGSVKIGDNVRMGGRVGLTDHLTVGNNAEIAAGSAVLNNIPAGEIWAGMPAKPIKTWQRELIWLKQKAGRKGDK